MKTKKINFDFYKIKYKGKNTRKLSGILKSDITKFDTFYKNGRHNSFPYKIKEMNGFILGTILANHMEGLPSSYDNKHKTLEDLKLEGSQGLAYLTSFLYDSELEIMMFESNKNGCSIGVFCSLVENNIEQYILDPQILINPSDLVKLNEMEEIRKITVKLHNIKNGAIIKDTKNSVGELIQFANDIQNDYLEFSIVKSNKGSLTVNKVIDLVKKFLKLKKEDHSLEKLEIKGRGENERKLRVLDLISNKLRPHIFIKTPRFIGVNTINEKYIEMASLYIKLREEFKNAYSE